MKKQPKQITHLSTFEWETLIGALRYFEYRATIASSMYPGSVVEHYWKSGNYSEEVQKRIAHQFANIDHHNGTSVWENDRNIRDRDKLPWCKFYAFCDAVANDSFKTLTLDDKQGRREDVVAFYCSYSDTWYPRDEYINNTHVERYISKNCIQGE